MTVMTREEAKRRVHLSKIRLEVEEHFANGGEIEYIDLPHTGLRSQKWNRCLSPVFNWDDCDYRIKPETKYRPFGEKDIVVGAIVRLKSLKTEARLVCGQLFEGGNMSVEFGHGFIRAEKMLMDYEMSVDGGSTWTPCGVPLPYEQQQIELKKNEGQKVVGTSASTPKSGDWKPGNHPE